MLATVELPPNGNPEKVESVSKLSDRLQQAKAEHGLSISQIVNRAVEAGYELSDYSAKVYTNGKHPARPKVETLEALAYALKVPEAELMELAGLPDRRTFSPHEDADLLTTAQQNAVNEIIAYSQRETTMTLHHLIRRNREHQAKPTKARRPQPRR